MLKLHTNWNTIGVGLTAQTCRDGGTADALDSGSSTCMGVGVQIPFSAVISSGFQILT